MTCSECLLARTDPDDDEDIYSCPFDLSYCFHSGEKCHHLGIYLEIISKLRRDWNLYDKIISARLEMLDNNNGL